MRANRKMKYTIPALAAALALTVVLPVQAKGECGTDKAVSCAGCQANEEGERCGTDFSVYNLSNRKSTSGKASSSGYKCTIAVIGGNSTGVYTGDWKNNMPHGEGNFSGKTAEGFPISIIGSWSQGRPHGQCQMILKLDTCDVSYTGDFFYGELRGSGEQTIVYSRERAQKTGISGQEYEGEFAGNQFSGEGKMTEYCTKKEAEETGITYYVYEGQFSDDALNGVGVSTIYYTEESAARNGITCMVTKGEFTDFWTDGECIRMMYYTQAFEKEYGYDCEVRTGTFQKGTMVEPYNYVRYKDGRVYEQGRVRNGKHVSDGEKAVRDFIYDGLREAFEDEGMGDLFDMFGPMFYDRNGK